MNAPTTAPTQAPQSTSRPMLVSKGNQFARSLKSEFLKLMTVRSTLVWAILFTGCLYGPMVLFELFSTAPELKMDWANLLTGAMIFTLLAIVFGASSTAGEFNGKMNAHAFLTQKARWHWLAARYVAVVLFIVAMWFIGVGLALLVVTVWPHSQLDGGSLTPVWFNAIAMPVYAIIGAGVAAVTRSRVAGLTVPLVWMFVIEPLMRGLGGTYKFLETLYKWSPGHVVQDVTTANMGLDIAGATTVPHGLLVFAIWTAVAVIAGLIVNQKRDVN